MPVMFLYFIRLGKAVQHLVFGGSNYTFHDADFGQWRNWKGSRRACERTGNDLVSIESLKEWMFLNSTIQAMETGEYFIGLKKIVRSGEWRWISDNSKVNATKGTFPWAKSEPNGDGDCAVMYKSYKEYYGEYNDLSCIKKFKEAGYICESHNENSGKEGMSRKLYTFLSLTLIFFSYF